MLLRLTNSSSPTFILSTWLVPRHVSGSCDESAFQIGLDSLALFCRKKSYGTRINNKLYCSQISKEFVLKKFPLFPEKTIVGLIPNEPRTIHVYDSCDIFKLRATAIPSNHCPGSLMFLFESLMLKERCARGFSIQEISALTILSSP